MRFAYADPPYLGQAKKHYAKEASADGRVAAEVDHEELIARMNEGYDGWALSLSSVSAEEIFHICRRVVGKNIIRQGAWCKTFCSFKNGVDPAYAWEPVIFRSRREWRRDQMTIRDWVTCPITTKRGVSGAKPDRFCFWLFDLLGMEHSSLFHDLFPGSGAVTRAHEMWCNQTEITSMAVCMDCSMAGFPAHGHDVPLEMGTRPCASRGAA